jgi:hypothetical protein
MRTKQFNLHILWNMADLKLTRRNLSTPLKDEWNSLTPSAVRNRDWTQWWNITMYTSWIRFTATSWTWVWNADEKQTSHHLTGPASGPINSNVCLTTVPVPLFTQRQITAWSMSRRVTGTEILAKVIMHSSASRDITLRNVKVKVKEYAK